MSREKFRKIDLELNDRDDIKKVEAEIQPSQKILLDFDLYFQKLMVKNTRVQAHHKAPMRKFSESKGFKEATEDQFDEIFKEY